MKARYQEVLLIVGLHVMGMVAMSQSFTKRSDSTGIYLLFSSFSIIVLIISTILSYGFLRTVHLDDMKRQLPAFLFTTGRKFFWRFVRFQILCMIIFLPLLLISISMQRSESSSQTAQWIPLLLPIIPTLIFIKPLILMPALIIVMDCRVRQSWQFMLSIKLLDAKEIVALYCAMLVISFFFRMLMNAGNSGDVESQNIFNMIPVLITQILGLITSIMAVRFVAYCKIPESTVDKENIKHYEE